MDSPIMADEDSAAVLNDSRPIFYIGHHDGKRTDVSPQLLQQAQDCGYAMVTVPITTPYFNLRVLNLLLAHMAKSSPKSGALAVPMIPSLSALDTNLAPGEMVSQLLGVISPWIDLCSPDPVIFNLSRQVLEMEVAYAAFCGIGNLILPSPKLHHGKSHGEGIAQYAHAVQQALEIGSFIQISITMPMMDNPHDVVEETKGSLALQARAEHVGTAEDDWKSVQDAKKSLESRPEELLDINPRKSVHVSSKHDYFGTWDAWNVIRTICRYNSRLFVALIIPRYLPSAAVCARWHSEPLRVLYLNPRTFFDNKGGYPVLHKEHRSLINRYMRLRSPPWIVLSDVAPIPGFDNPEAIFSAANGQLNHSSSMDTTDTGAFPTPSEATADQSNSKNIEPLHHLNILRRLQQEQPPQTVIERFGAGYQDYLQAPLQPLTDNLESITYEVFEKDPVKYDLYLQAIERALMDWRQQNKPTSGPSGKIIVAVVGAGRGPLVTRALQASESTGVPIELWALEKNPNAFVLLERHNMLNWKNQVQLVRSDMRSWKGPSRAIPIHQRHPNGNATSAHPQQHYPIDILISELIGSFADNELSPECLDGILPLLNPIHGLSIPRSYTAFLTPIAAPKLHADILSRTPSDKEAPNTPYVVMLHAVDYLSNAPSPTTPTVGSTAAQPPAPHVLAAWSFHHGPTKTAPSVINTHNTRQARLSFSLKDRAVCHGLAGYFESVLYPGVELSTHPHTMEQKSAGMMSWFPIFFPLKACPPFLSFPLPFTTMQHFPPSLMLALTDHATDRRHTQTPLYTPDNATLTVSIFRNTDARKVWYEWMLEAGMDVPSTAASHDLRASGEYQRGSAGGGGEGKRIRLGVSEVGSSRERGCMM